ncbi:unnamed protein product, partial [Closterium sp. NIES-64]
KSFKPRRTMAPPEGSLGGSTAYLAHESVISQRVVTGTDGDGEVRKKGAPELVNTDFTATRQEYLFKPPRWIDTWLVAQLNHPKDAPLAYATFNIVCMSVPAALAVVLITTPGLGGVGGWKGNLIGATYVVLHYVLFMQRYMLALHFSEHLMIYKKTFAGKLLSHVLPTFVSILFGVAPGFYRLHHCIMHHVENNLYPNDLSSTEPYQRDNFLHFVVYWLRFWLLSPFEMPLYAFRTRRYGACVKSAVSISLYSSLLLLFFVAPIATLWVVFVPFCLTSFLIMFGNFSQHIFIDPNNSRSNYALTYNCMNAPDNQKTFNDGYHILHHANSQIHWLDLPHRFMETLDVHAREDAIVFRELHFIDVGILVFTGQLKKLATYYVNIGQPQRTQEELVEMFKERLKPIKPGSASKGKAQ